MGMSLRLSWLMSLRGDFRGVSARCLVGMSLLVSWRLGVSSGMSLGDVFAVILGDVFGDEFGMSLEGVKYLGMSLGMYLWMPLGIVNGGVGGIYGVFVQALSLKVSFAYFCIRGTWPLSEHLHTTLELVV